ncbi:hypothetical protein M0R45_018536 [Rubus argutus]|uniref:SET domain-containing protein n=1 Tax=Rubus argutus TaxID=59490 RepID=A0AAW1X2R8_RUBAR
MKPKHCKIWELIEDENYRVLFDVLMPEEERVKPKGKESLILEPKKRSLGMTSSHKEAPSCVKTEVVELRITGQEEQHALSLSKSCLDSTHLEGHIRMILEVKSKNKESPLYDDTEVVKLPAKRLYTRQQKKQALSLSKSGRAHQSDDDLFSDSEEAQPLLKKKLPKRQEEKVLICDAKIHKTAEKKESSLAKSCMETTPSTMARQNDGDLFSDSEESEDSPLLSRRYRGRHQKEDILVSGIPPPAQSPIVICLDTSSDSDGGNVDEDRLEVPDVEQLIVENKNCVIDLSQTDDDEDSLELLEVEPLIMDSRSCVLDTSRVDVASSPLKGQVSVSLACNSAIRSDFHLPYIQVVEERCNKPQENGECFLAIGTDSIVDKSERKSGKGLKVLQGLQSSKICKVEAAQNHWHSHGVVKPCVYVDDITRGEERVKIPLEDGLLFKLLWELSGISCTMCLCYSNWGWVCLHTRGIVKETFLEEYLHLNQEPKKSTTSINCGNRIVQQGISAKLKVFLTPEGKGWGLRTLQDLPRGAFVCEYVGEIVTSRELRDRNMQNAGKRQTYPVLLDANWGSEGVLKDEEALCLDATVYGNVARFINHRCSDATLIQIPVEVETPDHHYYHLALFTTRNVAAMEELTWDYGIDFDDHDHPVKPFNVFVEVHSVVAATLKFRHEVFL